MKRAYKIFWVVLILLIPVFPLSGLTYGVNISDVGLSINQYRFCFEDIGSVYLPILLTEFIGGAWFKICGFLSIPGYIGVEILWVLCCYYLSFLSYRMYRKYDRDEVVLPALALALLFAKCNFHYFIYATGVAVMALTGLFFLVRALEEKKTWKLSVAVFFFVMATLCKVSSLLQFAVFAVLFYDFYKKRDKGYFIRQILYCVAGFVAGLAVALLFIQVTCGVGAYADMLVSMFFYAGSSEDGHTIGNMIMSNLKGTLRGLALLAALGVVWAIPKKFPGCRKAFQIGIPAAVLLLLVGKITGLAALPGVSAVYDGIFFRYLNALAVIAALVYVCTALILLDATYPDEFKLLALSTGVLTVLMPIGSNTGIEHLCNELYCALPFIFISVSDRARRAAGGRTKFPAVGVMLTAVTAAWCAGLAGYQSLYLTRNYLATEKEVKACSLDELKFMKYEADVVEELEEVTRHLKQYEGGERRLLVAGTAVILNYLSGMPPFNEGCGGWIETEFITYEQIGEQLAEAQVHPIVVLCTEALEGDRPKIRLVADFVEENPYEEVYTSEEYRVFYPVGKK